MKFLELTLIVLLDTKKEVLTKNKTKKIKDGYKVLKDDQDTIGLSKKVLYRTRLYKITNSNF